MLGMGKHQSSGRKPINSDGWISRHDDNNAKKNRRDLIEKPIPRPTTELGFRGIRHKTSGVTKVSRPSEQ